MRPAGGPQRVLYVLQLCLPYIAVAHYKIRLIKKWPSRTELLAIPAYSITGHVNGSDIIIIESEKTCHVDKIFFHFIYDYYRTLTERSEVKLRFVFTNFPSRGKFEKIMFQVNYAFFCCYILLYTFVCIFICQRCVGL